MGWWKYIRRGTQSSEGFLATESDQRNIRADFRCWLPKQFIRAAFLYMVHVALQPAYKCHFSNTEKQYRSGSDLVCLSFLLALYLPFNSKFALHQLNPELPMPFCQPLKDCSVSHGCDVWKKEWHFSVPVTLLPSQQSLYLIMIHMDIERPNQQCLHRHAPSPPKVLPSLLPSSRPSDSLERGHSGVCDKIPYDLAPWVVVR